LLPPCSACGVRHIYTIRSLHGGATHSSTSGCRLGVQIRRERRAAMSRAKASRATLAIAASGLAVCIGASAAQAKDAKTARPPVVDPRADRLLTEVGGALE